MKKLIIAVCMFITTTTFAQNEKFMGAMGATLQQFGTAKTAEEMTAVAQKFERIAEAEKTQWLAYYYAALVKARMSMNGMGGDKDVIADQASELIAKAESLEKNNSEILCVKSMIATAKMLVDPQTRYMQYGMDATKLLEEAKKADVTNPRPYMLQANSLRGTPENFGGGCKTAKPAAEKAIELYATYKASSPIHPNWGKESVEQIVASCK